MSISSYVHNSSDDQSLPEDQMTIYVQGNQCARIMNISRHKSAYMQGCHPLDFMACTRCTACTTGAQHRPCSSTRHYWRYAAFHIQAGGTCDLGWMRPKLPALAGVHGVALALWAIACQACHCSSQACLASHSLFHRVVGCS